MIIECYFSNGKKRPRCGLAIEEWEHIMFEYVYDGYAQTQEYKEKVYTIHNNDRKTITLGEGITVNPQNIQELDPNNFSNLYFLHIETLSQRVEVKMVAPMMWILPIFISQEH